MHAVANLLTVARVNQHRSVKTVVNKRNQVYFSGPKTWLVSRQRGGSGLWRRKCSVISHPLPVFCVFSPCPIVHRGKERKPCFLLGRGGLAGGSHQSKSLNWRSKQSEIQQKHFCLTLLQVSGGISAKELAVFGKTHTGWCVQSSHLQTTYLKNLLVACTTSGMSKLGPGGHMWPVNLFNVAQQKKYK